MSRAFLDVTFAPCNYIQYAYEGDTIDPSCVRDLDKQIEYLNKIQIVTLHNNERLDPEGFGVDSIIKESKITSKQVDD